MIWLIYRLNLSRDWHFNLPRRVLRTLITNSAINFMQLVWRSTGPTVAVYKYSYFILRVGPCMYSFTFRLVHYGLCVVHQGMDNHYLINITLLIPTTYWYVYIVIKTLMMLAVPSCLIKVDLFNGRLGRKPRSLTR